MNQAQARESLPVIKDALEFAFRAYASNFLLLLAVMVLLIGGAQIFRMFLPGLASVGAAFIYGTFLAGGMLAIFLSITDGGSPTLSLLGEKAGLFWRYLVAHVIAYLATITGFILFVVPGIILMICFLFYPVLIVDKNLGPIEAIGKSISLTSGHRMKLFLLGLSVVGVLLLAGIPVFIASSVVGLGAHFAVHLSFKQSMVLVLNMTNVLITPVSVLVMTHAYRQLTSNAEER